MTPEKRDLSKNGAHFTEAEQWTIDLEAEFVSMKEKICCSFVHKPFDINKKVIAFTDISKVGAWSMLWLKKSII